MATTRSKTKSAGRTGGSQSRSSKSNPDQAERRSTGRRSSGGRKEMEVVCEVREVKSGGRASARSSRSSGTSSRGSSSAKASKTGGRRGSSNASSQKSGSRSRHGEVKGAGQPTTDHELIRTWVEERGGKPACVRGTGGKLDTGMLRIDMPGYSGKTSLAPISWDDWFEKFDEKQLAFLYQDETAGGKKSNFNKLVSR